MDLAQRPSRLATTLDAALAARHGYGPGFDIFRHLAALTVLVSHSFPITSGNDSSEPFNILSRGQLTMGTLAVYVFFVISGFLIAQSADRSRNVQGFIRKRALRIMPGLLVVVVLTDLVLGPIVTTLPWDKYFGAAELWRNFKSLLFLPNTNSLPGVFKENPVYSAVNGSLWTLRHEVASYAVLALTVLFPALRRPRVIVAIALLCWALPALTPSLLSHLPNVLREFFPLASCFFAGTAFYTLRDRVPMRPTVATASAVVLLVSIIWIPFRYAGPFTLGYVVIFFGLLIPRGRLWPGHRDYSYGIYLYAFPIQQTVQLYLPSPWWLNSLISLPLTLACGALSWHLVERRALALKGPSGIGRISATALAMVPPEASQPSMTGR
jgi:peptidoglycan/LPS O-acetylase OafA/YrhL